MNEAYKDEEGIEALKTKVNSQQVIIDGMADDYRLALITMGRMMVDHARENEARKTNLKFMKNEWNKCIADMRQKLTGIGMEDIVVNELLDNFVYTREKLRD